MSNRKGSIGALALGLIASLAVASTAVAATSEANSSAGTKPAATAKAGNAATTKGHAHKKESRAEQQFQASVHHLLPLTPSRIRRFHKHLNATNRAIHDRKPARLDTRTQPLRLEPGAPIPTVRIAPGYVSDIVILDDSGAPWPITSIALGDSSAFEVQHPQIKDGNLLTVSAKGQHRDSNLSITLKGWAMPIIVHLTTDASISQSLIALRADQQGPNGKPAEIGPPPAQVVGGTLMAFLDNVPPSGASARQLKGAGSQRAQAWIYKKHLYLRTNLAPVWPAWDNVARGVGHMHVYRMPIVDQVQISVGGEIKTLQVGSANPASGAENNG